MNNHITDTIKRQDAFFKSGKTRDLKFRLDALKTLYTAINEFEEKISSALKSDLNKSAFESYETEIATTSMEIKFFMKKLKKWIKPQKVPVSIFNYPARGRIIPEPYGRALIFSAWNYPFHLLISPLAGAMAAGNCATLKPSNLAPATAETCAEMLNKYFSPEYIAPLPGKENRPEEILNEKFDYIFFTGNPDTGGKVMRQAASHLTPITLELGGKSPCIIDKTAKTDLAAKRIVWGKFLNAGQTCVAPDYILIHPDIKPDFLDSVKKYIKLFFGEFPEKSPDYPRIINIDHFDRINAMIDSDKVISDGSADREKLFIPPTIMNNVNENDRIMRDEIFGPVLPLLDCDNEKAAIDFVNSRPKPLAVYIFSTDKKSIDRITRTTSSGGVCVNEVITHLSNPSMPFGGVGQSGMGAYHGKYSFDTFTHFKPVMEKSNLFDLNTRYAPYKEKLKLLKKIMR